MEDRTVGLGHLLVPEGDLAALAAQTLFRSGEPVMFLPATTYSPFTRRYKSPAMPWHTEAR